MATESTLKCECGEEIRLSGGPEKAPAACPRCARPISVPPVPGAVPVEAPGQGIEQILLKKGWVTAEQLKAARDRQEEEGKKGKKIRIGEALVDLGFVPAERIREALGMQGKAPMRCPSCGKSYNVWGYKAGMKPQCKTCGKALVPADPTADLHVEDTGTQVQHVPVGESVDPSVVDLVPGYRIERKLGSGGMGTVYLARQKALDRLVAIKVLSKELATDTGYVQRFLAEARSAARLSQENIVAAVDAGESKGSYYFVMEYVEGETLEEAIRREGALPERRALEIARQVAAGLAHAAKQGLIHRDIKPSNVILTPAGSAKICDFGLAREMHSDVRMTQAGMVHSSPAYASPEQCKGHSRLDARADMYSLGVTLFEMLTGQLPFKSGAPSALFVAHVTETPPSPRTVKPSVSQAASALVLRLLKKDPGQRFGDYPELLAEIDAVRTGGRPTAQKRPSPVPSAAPRRATGVPVPWAIAGVVLLLVGAVAYFALGKSSSSAAGASVPEAKGGDSAEVDREIAQVRGFEKAVRGIPAQYPAVRARWKALEDRYRNTSFHNAIAGPLLEFESRRSEEADRSAELALSDVAARVEQSRLAEALSLLREFPHGFEETPAARRIEDKMAEVTRLLEGRYQATIQVISTHIANEHFDEALKLVGDLKTLASAPGPSGPAYVRPSMEEEIAALRRRIEEDALLARRRDLEAQKKAEEAKAAAGGTAASVASKPAVRPASSPSPGPATSLPAPAPPSPAPAVPAAEPKRLPVPSPSALKESETLIRDLFKDDYGRKAPQDKLALSRKMIDLAHQTKDDPAGRFVLFSQAGELAASAGSVAGAYGAIDELSREFAVDARALKSAALQQVAQTARQPEEIRSLGLEMLKGIDLAIAADDFEGALHAVQAVSALGRKAKDITLVAKAEAKLKECEEGRARFEQYRKSVDVLSKNPNDPEACLQVGRYLCSSRGDWAQGLPLLAKGANPALKDVAARDLASPGEAPAMVAIADEWWDLSEKETAVGRAAYRRRSAYWYELAAPKLTGFTKVRAEKRLAEAATER